MTRSALTERQKQLLEVIYKYITDTGYPPSFEEMKNSLAVASNQSIIDLLIRLENQKLIKRNESQARSITILPLGFSALGQPPLVPFLGVSHAGSTIVSAEINGEWQTMSSDLKRLSDEVFILKISGDSMINAGINDGDKILVQSKKEFVSGDIVLADVDGESTVKRFISDDNPPYIYLKPENPNYEVIPFTDRMRLIGKVISVVKGDQMQGVR